MFRRLAVACLVLFMAMAMQSGTAFAQGKLQSGTAFAQGKKDKGPAERTMTGVVSDESGKPVAGAVVQLTNTKTLQIRSFISKDDGEFYFNGLSTDTDYEVTAKAGEKKSGKRVLSSFDSRKQAIVNITIK